MCGRFTLALSAAVIKDYFGIESELDISLRYNIAPSQPVVVVRQLENQPREFALLRWRLIPSWMKEENLHSAGWINARIETAYKKPAFRQAFKHRRCLIVADGFYEWQQLSAKRKQPYYIHKKDKSPLAMAGVWESWNDKSGHVIESCAILTMSANKMLSSIHDRMPVILKRDYFKQWLDPNNQNIQDLRSIIKCWFNLLKRINF